MSSEQFDYGASEDPMDAYQDEEIVDFIHELSDEYDYPLTGPTGARFLNQKDYTLNSPLIKDEVQELPNFLLGRPFSTFFLNERLWNKRKRISERRYRLNPVFAIYEKGGFR